MLDLKSQEKRLKELIAKANEQAGVLNKVSQEIEVIRQENFRLKEENVALNRRNESLRQNIDEVERVFTNDTKQKQKQKEGLKGLVLELQEKYDKLKIEYLDLLNKRNELAPVALELNQIQKMLGFLSDEKMKLSRDILKSKLGYI